MFCPTSFQIIIQSINLKEPQNKTTKRRLRAVLKCRKIFVCCRWALKTHVFLLRVQASMSMKTEQDAFTHSVSPSNSCVAFFSFKFSRHLRASTSKPGKGRRIDVKHIYFYWDILEIFSYRCYHRKCCRRSVVAVCTLRWCRQVEVSSLWSSDG